eukprot:246711-Pelagomonas_calceolata.AAC.2
MEKQGIISVVSTVMQGCCSSGSACKAKGTTLLGFVGTPWTLAAYSIEGKADKDCKETKV